jgi:antitoxin component YwqK of YwqJK toxin-antitoxin module
MAADIMAHPALLRNKLFQLFLIGLLFSGCNASAPTVPASFKLLPADEPSLTNDNGVLLHNNVPFTGTLFSLFVNTTDTAAIKNFLNGKEHGEWKQYHKPGLLQSKRYFINGKKTGSFIAWWANGRKQMEYHFVNDEYEGTCREWNETGFLNRIMNYTKGHENGPQQWWYDNGKIKANYIIKDGRRFGLLGTKNCINVSDSIFKQ